MKKYLKIFLCSVLIVAVFSLNAFAFSGSTYSDLAQSSSTVQNLISYANNFPGFVGSDFVVFQSAQYSYYIFWGDIDYDGSVVTADKADFISYIREGTGYDYAYTYTHGDEESLSLTVNNLVVSNIDELGSTSALFQEYRSYYSNTAMGVFVVAFLFVLMCLAFRRTFKT